MKNCTILFICLLMCLAAAGSVAAHAELASASPEPGAQLAESPAEIRLTFNEPVASTSSIALLTADFQPVEGLVGQFNADRPQEIYAPLPELTPGVYTVQWTAASDDGHEISGTYSFSVGLVTPGAPTVAPTATATPEPDGGSSVGWWLAALLAVAVGAPLLIVALRRARR